ncbi:MAG: M28 family peptidase, partial [Mucilaginibacter sp.]
VDILTGSNGSADFANVSRLVKYVEKRGAVAAIERYKADAINWHFMRSGIITNHPADALPARQFPQIIVSDSPALQNVITAVAAVNATIEISGTKVTEIALKNVIAYVKGTDPLLSKQFIVLSSHYDHLGVAPGAVMEEGKMDSIYNGARDNATGTTAVIAAARYFSKHPPKRSILFATYTAEEEGLIGSAYYAEHPIVPLAQTIYNLNIDNASYNDTTVVTLVGLKRTSADPLIIKALKAYSLTINNDPTGGGLFSESDNLPLAEKGIPAPTYSLGMTALDGTIFNRYHQLSDETGNMDMSYVLKFIRAFILSAKYIADDPGQPTWTKNDEFEKVWQQLFKATGK